MANKITSFSTKRTLNFRGKLFGMERPLVMGILNCTPDSFYDGGKFEHIDKAMEHVKNLLDEGADILDIGGMSSRPGAQLISAEEERKRVLPLIKAILKDYPDTLISIDTIRADVAKAAVDEGALMVNDISAGRMDKKMFETVAGLHVPYVMMHMQGLPADMQANPQYDDIVSELLDFFNQRNSIAQKAGINDIIIDPGFGFGKTLEHNFTLLRHLELFSMLEYPVLVGMSRKSMIYKLLNCSPDEALNATTGLNTIALMKGAAILRVHDVKEAKEAIQIVEQLIKA